MTRIVKRDTRVRIERATYSQNSLGEEIPTWSEIARPWAAVFYGKGEERRQAAAMQGQQSVTLNLLSSPTTQAVRITDRVVVGAEVWDIVGVSPIGRKEIDLTAVRAP